ncbi:hypothetical protein SLEP1_g35792 [Rubroshorea leprosula]|uniref:Uncharacterized protein n=1 Tax=Rubroshorea leprosula TaxID=152421 RepID=A0AAV5KPL0_9ROSI|nr:hypothetical protein SLEP1_g35792 [Rubroshorea leprosula]
MVSFLGKSLVGFDGENAMILFTRKQIQSRKGLENNGWEWECDVLIPFCD